MIPLLSWRSRRRNVQAADQPPRQRLETRSRSANSVLTETGAARAKKPARAGFSCPAGDKAPLFRRRLFLDLRPVEQLDQRNGRVVAFAETGFQDAKIAAVALGVARPQFG